MGNIKWTALILSTTVVLFILVNVVQTCNEQVCASMVSKCMLTQSCKCDLKNCSCCKECYNCLSYLYSECCSCVDMCPKPNATLNALSKKSHVEELEGIPGLFKALTDASDDEENWSTFSFPVDFDAALYGAKLDKDFKYYLRKLSEFIQYWKGILLNKFFCIFQIDSTDQDLDASFKERESIITYNCTVAFMSQCLSWNKCKTNCQSMGATSYRYIYIHIYIK